MPNGPIDSRSGTEKHTIGGICVQLPHRGGPYLPAKGTGKTDRFHQHHHLRSTAEFVSRYFRKGQLVAVQGSIQTGQYTDRDGNKRTAFDVVADNVFFAEKKAESGETKQGAGYDHSPDIQGDFEEIISPDELPF